MAYQSFMFVQCSCTQPSAGADAVGMTSEAVEAISEATSEAMSEAMSNRPSGMQTPQLRRHAFLMRALASHCSGVTCWHADAGNSASQSMAPSSMQARGGGECGWPGWPGGGGACGGGGGGGKEMSSDHVRGAGFDVVGAVACFSMVTLV